MKKLQWKRLPLTTLEGIKQAERLQAAGWRIIASSPFAVIMEGEKQVDNVSSSR